MKILYFQPYYKRLLFTIVGLCLILLVGYELSILRSIGHVPISMAAGPRHADDSGRSCRPQNKFIFAKTHKTGSSTIQNILMRRVFETNTTMVFPFRKTWMFPFNESFVASNTTVKDYYSTSATPYPTAGGHSTFGTFLFHSRWNYKEVRRIVPEGPTITILRDPISVFESGYSYFGWKPIKNIDAFVSMHINGKWPVRSEIGWFGKNQILWDFGMTPVEMEVPRLVNQKIDQLSQEFDLVMIAEKMDESLLLMQDLLCWPLESITYLDQNQRKPEERNQMSEETREVLEQWLWADYMVYDHFRSVLDRKITEYETGQNSGPHQLQDRVFRLRSANRDLKRRCVVDHTDNAGGLEGHFKVALPNILGYKIKKDNFEQCRLYATTEPYFTNLLRTRQYPNEKPPKRPNPVHYRNTIG